MNAFEERYRDALGHERVVPEETRAAFRSVLSMAPPADELVARATVIRARTDAAFTLTLPAAAWSERVTWTVAFEGSGAERGTAELRDAPVVETFRHAETTFDRRSIALPDLPLGYHRLSVDAGAYGGAEATLIVVPPAAYLGPAERTWGIAAQLYTLRSGRNWGIGDFTDLAALMRIAAAAGARFVGINPLHALHRSAPDAASPYAPSSRRFLNWLAIDVTAVPEARHPQIAAAIADPEFAAQLERLRAVSHVDYNGVAECKDAILRRCFGLAGERLANDAAYRGFHDRGGVALERFAVFETLAERLGPDVERWPAPYRDPGSADVRAFAGAERPAVDYAIYLQYEAACQLETATAEGRRLGVMLYRDLAVGVDAHGADVWIDHHAYRPAISVGAPPDQLNPHGQDWGLPPLDPIGIAHDGYRTVAELFRANMAAAGALRIDHAMSLERLFWIPRGTSPAAGGYVQYPIDDLLGILALESVRARCTVVGEDLGTVPPGFRERMSAAHVLSYRILVFERDERGDFLPAERYPGLSLAATGTHDLSPFAAWLAGSDIDLAGRLAVLDPEALPGERRAREIDRRRLIDLLVRSGDLAAAEPSGDAVVVAAHRFLARSPARIVMLQLDDASGETMPVNVPGTWDQYPNWRRKLAIGLERIAHDARFESLCAVLRAQRPRSTEEDRS